MEGVSCIDAIASACKVHKQCGRRHALLPQFTHHTHAGAGTANLPRRLKTMVL